MQDVSGVRELAIGVIEGRHTPDELESYPAGKDLVETARLIAELDPAMWEKAAQYRFDRGRFTRAKREEIPGGREYYYLVRKGRIYPDSLIEDRDQAIDVARTIIRNELESEAEAKKGRSKYTKISAYRDHRTKEVFLGFKLRGVREVQRLKTGFADAKSAFEYLDANRDDLQAKIDEMRKPPTMRRDENRARVGPDRHEADVSPEQFGGMFGFRGVQFGNYVEGPRRQQDLNRAYDALMDMADAVDIPPKAVSLNGTLGLAFGARGRGGRAAAHYEPDQVVITSPRRRGRALSPTSGCTRSTTISARAAVRPSRRKWAGSWGPTCAPRWQRPGRV